MGYLTQKSVANAMIPILAGAPGPAGLQNARSRAGAAGQNSGFCPLDFQHLRAKCKLTDS